ncbi:MAG TPA: hypothetical protein VFX02_04010 [Gammaproteobacteria bacterium]|nr:hypothetical protein [Gammaproteobacteria bacterium]
MINSRQFLDAFKSEWKLNENRDDIPEMYTLKRDWTSFMLDKNKGFLVNVMRRLSKQGEKLEYRSFYTIDAMYVSGDLYKDECRYPSTLHALIEHENGDYIEEEMWKMLFWRAPLKVIIFYDWDEHEKKTETKLNWLTNKLRALGTMRTEALKFYPEDDMAQYLFIVGNRKEKNRPPEWRYAACGELTARPL